MNYLNCVANWHDNCVMKCLLFKKTFSIQSPHLNNLCQCHRATILELMQQQLKPKSRRISAVMKSELFISKNWAQCGSLKKGKETDIC